MGFAASLARLEIVSISGACVANSGDKTAGYCTVFGRTPFSRGSQRCHPLLNMLKISICNTSSKNLLKSISAWAFLPWYQ